MIPVQLQQQGVCAQGTVMLPRGWMSCTDVNIKADLLNTMWILPAAKAVARPGDPDNWKAGASELLLGAMLGQDRTTTCRMLAKFSATVCGRCYGKGKLKSGVRSQESESEKANQEKNAVSVVAPRDREGISVRGLEAQGHGDSFHHTSTSDTVNSRRNGGSAHDHTNQSQLTTCPKCNGAGTRDAEVVELLHKWRPGIGCVNHYEYVEATGNRQQAAAGPKAKDSKKDHPLNNFNPEKLAARYPVSLECCTCEGQGKVKNAETDQEEVCPGCLGARTRMLFDAAAEGLDGCFPCELWIWDPAIKKTIRCICRKGQMSMNFDPQRSCQKCGGRGFTFHPTDKMGDSPRKVLAVLRSMGLGTLNTFLEKTNAQIGKMCGLCENTVSAALDEWEDHSVLQIAPGKVLYEEFNDPKTGKPAIKCRLPQRIIWLPGLLLDPAIAASERQRFDAHMIACQEKARLNGWALAGIHLKRIKELHTEMLRRWVMSRHSLGAFWRAMRKLIYSEGLTPRARDGRGWADYRNELFPVDLYRKLE